MVNRSNPQMGAALFEKEKKKNTDAAASIWKSTVIVS